MGNGDNSGGTPQTLGRCSECGSVYPVQTTASGELRPIGTDGGCECGNDDFEPVSE
ncbi:hypothetical protein SAMN05216559_1323 [Halomicrobium zhouii]|uniref:Uncharacterized protein n=1 Tax=Halomicrobium zhouii TaxID=767519 RepID=A0A1I6KQS3_9EURY|nr:hypothetical protein [Halomicrobium zhouii]SFR93566.1 hypothetical protein SAMN05216559_1323 [Halomicrobium zhouii]